jgi:anti-anti-sigma factor
MRHAEQPRLAERGNGARSALAVEAFSIEIRPDRSRVLVVPHGDLDLATVGSLATEIDELVSRGFDALVIDLRATSFIDSTGIRLMLTETRRTDARITLIDGSDIVSRVFDLTGVRELLPFEPAP